MTAIDGAPAGEPASTAQPAPATPQPTAATPQPAPLNVAPGSTVRVRDEDWLVTSTEATTSGTLIRARGLSELVRDCEAAFYSELDDITVVDPRQAHIIADDSPRYRKSRLFLETILRKTPEPTTSQELAVSGQMLANRLTYQHIAVAKALDAGNVRPRILIADAVGLGKTLEIGMILSELVARGRGENILIVTPRHVLEQMQHEMWCRFALPFVRLDSQGIQRIRQKIPATRNPFTYFKRAIISIDTLKSPRYREHLRKRRWDAVVIDESHNLMNRGTQNNELARILAPRTDALILASATPHNGNRDSFAELIRLLDPTAVSPSGEINEEAAKQLIVRRHRYSPEVAAEVGAAWAERQEPSNILVRPSPAEDAVAAELAANWLYTGSEPLFGWTLAKAFLSSPAALLETVDARLATLNKRATTASPSSARSREDLVRLRSLAERATREPSGKLDALVELLQQKGVGGADTPDTRAVIFAERIATLKYLERTLPKALKLPPQAFGLLHGGLTDMEQQEIVEEFKRGNSPLRVLITGDVASEGVNLHSQCHVLVHFDIPWSLIRIEQRNGRIDRYGQHNPPDISTLLLQPSSEKFSGDLRVLTKLMEKEHAAHKILPDVASIMGKNSVEAEERAIAKVLAEQRPLDDAVPPTDDFDFFDFLDAPIDSVTTQAPPAPRVRERGGMFATDLDFLQEALAEAFGDPHEKVDWRVADGVASLTPPPDLARRLAFLPRDYLRERRVTERLQLATTPVVGESALRTAQQQEDTNWPAAHFLGPLHPVLDWASDRALASLSHNEVLAVRGPVDQPTYLLLGTITNQRGQIITRSFMQVADGFCTPLGHVGAELISASNPGPVDVTGLDCAQAVTAGENYLRMVAATIKEAPLQALERWLERAERWDEEAGALVQRSELRERRDQVAKEHELATQMKPAQQLVRPLLVIVPEDS